MSDKRVIFLQMVFQEDGKIISEDVTKEVLRMKQEANTKKLSNEIMSVEEVAELLKIKVRSVRNKMCNGEFLEGTHYKRLSRRHVVFYKKALLEMLGLP
ncbi:MAG: hypothetical protein AB7E48_09910 [Deferribacterales bacterium]|jgi:hypothetical protein|uniref:DNA-binding protein n=1 Tax=Geovibrio thiophilus TaxID=139438 RepID=A0A410K123_9BACT|nr:helix-turn-helix domain-containing protein [Geovibrio thiophilus]QAR34025.1 DNA-binding protein [Geovibrio thiophilus]